MLPRSDSASGSVEKVEDAGVERGGVVVGEDHGHAGVAPEKRWKRFEDANGRGDRTGGYDQGSFAVECAPAVRVMPDRHAK